MGHCHHVSYSGTLHPTVSLLAAPGIAEAAVIAVPDDVMGEKAGAVLFGGSETVDVQQVFAHCRDQC
jgi:non-ribosomal peptide synthetase component E (peptide arylation enzyme)